MTSVGRLLPGDWREIEIRLSPRNAMERRLIRLLDRQGYGGRQALLSAFLREGLACLNAAQTQAQDDDDFAALARLVESVTDSGTGAAAPLD